jgi:hypothetical protein
MNLVQLIYLLVQLLLVVLDANLELVPMHQQQLQQMKHVNYIYQGQIVLLKQVEDVLLMVLVVL